jgi:hypothetical protein
MARAASTSFLHELFASYILPVELIQLLTPVSLTIRTQSGTGQKCLMRLIDIKSLTTSLCTSLLEDLFAPYRHLHLASFITWLAFAWTMEPTTHLLSLID